MKLKEAKKLINDRIRIAREYGGLVHLTIEDSEKIINLLDAPDTGTEETDSVPACPCDEDIFDALVTALEGGSNYWYYIPIPSDRIKKMAIKKAAVKVAGTGRSFLSVLGPNLPLVDYIWFLMLNDTSLMIYDIENTEDLLGEMSIDTLRKGAVQYIQERGEFDPAMDAGEADCFLQYAVLGEIVYC